MSGGMINNLHLLPAGEGKIVKITKYGIWVRFEGTSDIFIYFSDTFHPSEEELNA